MIGAATAYVRIVRYGVLCLIALWCWPAMAYEEVSVADGGSIAGKVTLSGEVAPVVTISSPIT